MVPNRTKHHIWKIWSLINEFCIYIGSYPNVVSIHILLLWQVLYICFWQGSLFIPSPSPYIFIVLKCLSGLINQTFFLAKMIYVKYIFQTAEILIIGSNIQDLTRFHNKRLKFLKNQQIITTTVLKIKFCN